MALLTTTLLAALANSPEGSWQLKCFPIRNVSQSEILTFQSNGNATIDRLIYEDKACAQPLYRVFENVVYDVGRETAPKLFQLNLNVLTVEVEPLTNKATAIFADLAYCGLQDWQTNKLKDVLGKTCEILLNGERFSDFYHNPLEAAYTVFTRTEVGLFVGYPVGKSVDKRPTQAGPFPYLAVP